MSTSRDERRAEAEERLRRAEEASKAVEAQGEQVDNQVNLAERLLAGWRRVHERNHLAKLFREEGRLG